MLKVLAARLTTRWAAGGLQVGRHTAACASRYDLWENECDTRRPTSSTGRAMDSVKGTKLRGAEGTGERDREKMHDARRRFGRNVEG